jgi:hypothetical protein
MHTCTSHKCSNQRSGFFAQKGRFAVSAKSILKLAEWVNPSIQEKFNAPQLSLNSLMNHFKTNCVTIWLGFLKTYGLSWAEKRVTAGFFPVFICSYDFIFGANKRIHCIAVYSKASWLKKSIL